MPAIPKFWDRTRIRELVAILKPCQVATDTLQGNGPTASQLIVVVLDLHETIKELQCVYFKDFQEMLLKSLETRFEPVLNDDTYCLSAVFHPRIKTLVFRKENPFFTLKSEAEITFAK